MLEDDNVFGRGAWPAQRNVLVCRSTVQILVVCVRVLTQVVKHWRWCVYKWMFGHVPNLWHVTNITIIAGSKHQFFALKGKKDKHANDWLIGANNKIVIAHFSACISPLHMMKGLCATRKPFGSEINFDLVNWMSTSEKKCRETKYIAIHWSNVWRHHSPHHT